MSTSRSPERVVFFTDAVVAIAMTLLVLPLTEVVSELVTEDRPSVEAITGHQWQIYSFLLSFAVIARQWIRHHRLFEEVTAYSLPLMEVNMCWLLTIAVLPFPTEMVGAFGVDRFTVLFYIATILASSVCQTIMVLIVRGDANVARSPSSISDRWRATAIGSTVALAVALLLAGLVPGVGYFAILLVGLPPLITRQWYARRGTDSVADPV
ncbi:MAG: TMEM175 family protein [Pseudonocardiaceae bacterium]